MKLKKMIAAVLTLVLLSACITISAQAAAVVKLPKALTIVEEKAFYRCMALNRVEIPEGTFEIQSKAFADSSLNEIALPETIRIIADDAFEGCTDFWIEAESGSFAYEWAQGKGYSVRTPAPSTGEDELPWLPA